jgi:hypothetical protein
MGKNKKRKHIKRTFNHDNRKSHEPTVMELAFREAEDRRKDNAATKSIEGSKSSILNKPETVKPSESIKTVLQNNMPVNIVRAKSVSLPSPTAQNKKAPIALQRTQNKANSSRMVASPVQKSPTPVKLGLKAVPDKSLVLEDMSINEGTSRNDQEKDLREGMSLIVRTQAHNGSYKDERDIVIGFDFGTSSSKVIIRDSGLNIAYAVPFVPFACIGNSYLIPTRIFINEDGSISLSSGDHLYENIKSHLMDDPDRDIFTATNSSQSITVSEIATGYMALVIRFARDWFLKHTKKIYEKTNIYWHINLGIPSKNYGDIERQKIFQTIAMAAWRVSLNSKINIMDVRKILHESSEYINTDAKKIETEEWLHPDFVNTHPEVIMEVVGYARSPLRSNGLYLLIDIGATTLDVATFRINSHEDEDVFSLLETNVERLGTLMLHSKRIETMKICMQKLLQEKNSVDPIKPPPSLTYYEITMGYGEIAKGDENFFQRCSKSIGEVVRQTKLNRDHLSDVWETQLPVFICGGGGRHQEYRNIIEKLGLSLQNEWNNFKGFTIKEIPKPDQLEAPVLSPNDYDRLAIAYGLSFTSDEIGEVIPKDKINNIVQQKAVLNMGDKYVSKDMC